MADRELCERSIDDILQEAKEKNIALLVVGDPLGATTHTDMLLRAKDFGVKTQVICIQNVSAEQLFPGIHEIIFRDIM